MRDLMPQAETIQVRHGRDPDALVRQIVGGQPAIEPSDLEATPLIRVIIPVHDNARLLPEAVACVLAQEHLALELIILNDGSTEDIEGAIADLPVDLRLFHQLLQGAAAACHAGVALARGRRGGARGGPDDPV